MAEQFYLRICQIICFDIFKITLCRFIWFVTVIQALFALIFQAAHFLYVFKLHYVVQYGPSYVIVLYCILCCSSVPFCIEKTKAFQKKIDSNKIHCTDEELLRRNQRQTRKCTIFILGSALLGFFTGIIMMLPTEEDFFYFFHIFREFCPDFEDILAVEFRIGILLVIFVSIIAPGTYMVYARTIIEPQMYMLLNYIRNLHLGFENKETLDPEDQKIVKRRLVFCLKKHIYFTRCIREAVKQIEFMIYPSQTMCVLYLTSVIVLCFTMEQRSIEYWSLRAPLLITCAIYVGIGVLITGQLLEDTSVVCSEALYELNWYDWDEYTKKIYFIFLLNSSRQMTIRFSDTISINYEMGVEVIKAFFSAISLVKGLRDSRA